MNNYYHYAMPKLYHKQLYLKSFAGFSLVELSIVLVIIGLLTGGILSGQSLIRAAELRSITTEVEAYKTAANIFKDKYSAIPGDMESATTYWGKLSAYCNGDAGTASVTGVCNGDGDGTFLNFGGSPSAGIATELHMFWSHLAHAQLINGQFTGISGSGAHNWNSTAGVNVPASKISSTGYFATNTGKNIDPDFATHLAPYWFSIDYPDTMMYGVPFELGIDGNGALTSTEAWAIDKKIDDGKPATGEVLGPVFAYNATTATSTDDLDAEYNLINTGKTCVLAFKNAF